MSASRTGAPALKRFVIDFTSTATLEISARDEAHAREIAMDEADKGRNDRAIRDQFVENMQIDSVSVSDS